MPYDCFISYASADLGYAEELHRRLTAEGFKVWFDKTRLQPGFDWHREIEQGCENSRVFLPILTQRWKLSDWTKFETYGAEAIIPLILEGAWAEVCTPPLERFQAENIDLTHLDDSIWERLFAAIRRELAQPIPKKASRLDHLRHRANPYFVGREKDLIRLHEELHVTPRAVLTQGRVRAVVALGGVGKTTLARHYAEKFWRCYPQIFWVDARIDLKTGFARVHDRLFPDRGALGLSDADKAARALYELSSQETRLLIIDNAEDEQSVMAWIPKSGGCHTLITSRFAAWSAAVKTLYLYVLEPEMARQLLLSRAERQESISLEHPPGELKAVEDLARKLGFLPLALEQAAAYIGQQGTGFGFADYLELFSQAERELLAQGALGSTEYPDPVITTWKSTVDKLDPAARAVLRLSAFLAATPIPQEYFVKSVGLVRREAETFRRQDSTVDIPASPESAGDSFYVRQAVGQLKAYSMVQGEGHRFAVHPLVQAVERLNMPQEDLLPTLQNAVRTVNNARPESTDPEHRPAWEVLLPHAESLICQIRNVTGLLLDDDLLDTAGSAYCCKGWYDRAILFMRESVDLKRCRLGPEHDDTLSNEETLRFWLRKAGEYREVEPLLRRSIELYEEKYGRAHVKTLGQKHELGCTLTKLDNLSEAQSVLEEVLQGYESIQGADHRDTLTCLQDLGVAYGQQGLLDKAEEVFKSALQGYERTVGVDKPDTLRTKNNLGYCLYMKGDLAASEPMLREALQGREQVLDPEHPDLATTLFDLAEVYRTQGRNAEAEPLHRRALAIREKICGPDQWEVSQSLFYLAELYRGQGRYGEAEPLFRGCLSILEKVQDPEHSNVVSCLYTMAQLYQTQGRYDKAEPLYQRALSIFEKSVGPEDPRVATSLDALGSLYYTQGRYLEAEPLYRRALSIRKRTLGEEHLDVAQSLHNLAVLYHDQSRFEEAESLFHRAIAIMEQVEGAEPSSLSLSLCYLAMNCHAQKRYVEAEPLYRHTLSILEKLHGPQHPDVASILNHLAILNYAQNRYDEAEPLFLQSFEIREKVLGPDHLDVAQSLHNLTTLRHAQARYEEAIPILRRALSIQELQLGPEHLDVADSLKNLAVLYEALHDYAQAEPLYRRRLAIFEKVQGPGHRDTTTAQFNLAQWYRDRGKHEKAAELYRALLIRQEGLLERGENLDQELLESLAISHNNLAFDTLVPQGRWTEAENHYRRAMELFTRGVKEQQAVNSELNLLVVQNLAGKAVPVGRVEELTRILEKAKDSRAEKGRKLLKELLGERDDNPPEE